MKHIQMPTFSMDGGVWNSLWWNCNRLFEKTYSQTNDPIFL